MKHFLHQLKFVKFKDFLSIFVFLAALPASWIYKQKRKNMWLICERANEARDNGYWFYKYVKENHPEQDCVYAIKRNSPDYDKVAAIGGEIIEFGSFKHWVYYLSAELNISSQKEGKPNAAVCYLLEVYGIRKNRRVFLQHGIIKDDLKWLYYDVTKMWMFTSSTQREYEYCNSEFGYPSNSVVLTGLCRFDNLNDDISDGKTILIMPTHRQWLSRPIKEFEKYDSNITDFSKTEYFAAWKEVLMDERIERYIQDNKIKVVLYLHPNMQKYTGYFKELNTKITIQCMQDVDMQFMLKKAAVLITDYSSIFFDFAYMKKPLLYYQFDYDKFREGHYQKGYFSCERDGFGEVCNNPSELIEALCKIVDNGMKMPEQYASRVDDFFTFRDCNNCERTYQAIREKLDCEKTIYQ